MRVLDLAKQYEPHAVEVRRTLHSHPELGFEEEKTTELIRKELLSYGIEVQELPGLKTGITAVIRGGKPGKTLAIREDIDALPMTEQSGLEFASCNGLTHACGHDIHCSSLLLTARILQDMREELSGNVRLIFQPAEERVTGAETIIAAGVMELEPKCDCVIGFHCSPEIDAGTVGLIKGPANASTDTVYITVEGKGGHGAHPYRCVDPIITSAYMLTQLQTIISRENPAVQPAVLTFGTIQGGTAINVIPTEVKLGGTLRAFNEEGRRKIWDAIRRVAEYSCQAMRANAKVEIEPGVPSLINDEEVINRLRSAAEKTLGTEHIYSIPAPSPGSDDFSRFLELVPGAQFRVGTGTDDPQTRIGLHNPQNIFSEKAIVTGAVVMAQYALDYLV